MTSTEVSESIDAYLACRERTGRLNILAAMAEGSGAMPISLAEDLLCLELSLGEKVAIISATGSRDGRALEHFLTEHLTVWPQELAAPAVRRWSQGTDHLLWFRLLVAMRSPILPQRLLYTIVDESFWAGGSEIIRAALAVEGIEDMSPAFQGLLLERALAFDVDNPRLKALGRKIIDSLSQRPISPDHEQLPSALAYLARFDAGALEGALLSTDTAEPWRDVLRAMAGQRDAQAPMLKRLGSFLGKAPKRQVRERLLPMWPPLWQRHALPAELVTQGLSSLLDAEGGDKSARDARVREFFHGIPRDTLLAAIAGTQVDEQVATAVGALDGLLGVPASEELLNLVRERLGRCSDPASFLALLPLRLRLELTGGDSSRGASSPFALIKQEEARVLRGEAHVAMLPIKDYDPASVGEPALAMRSRKMFFDLAFRGSAVPQPGPGDGFFGLLAEAWAAPEDGKLVGLAQAARQIGGIHRLCYLKALGRFRGLDSAALKLLDFIRAKEEDELVAVIDALAGIGTARAAQELVAALTRPNMTTALQLRAAAALQGLELANLQAELRSALGDLSRSAPGDAHKDPERFAVREAIEALLMPSSHSSVASVASRDASGSSGMISDQSLDQALVGKIAHYKNLSSEVKRALRTSQFFHIQISRDDAPETIDLSPLIDMQYKALELMFREQFEESCSRSIHRGLLQRRLDIIGYARPIPRNMDEFEAYLASLPVVREIPFFSQFKLRKLLRGICQFRPGRRFTLDGLKAFALFFLCFGRHECRYGLNDLFPLGFATDRDLFEFCKMLHMQQDLRNRAAHEGFHPDAATDIDGIWRNTAELIQNAVKVGEFLAAQDATAHDPVASSRVS